MLPISSISPITTVADAVSPVSISSLEDTVKKLFSEYAVNANTEKLDIIEKSKSIDPSNPAQILNLQDQVGKYSLALNMVSTITHKVTSSIDSVIKAQ
ncbi:TPA: type III secretion system inner rod subunit SctI [Providencia alcalifaciens]